MGVPGAELITGDVLDGDLLASGHAEAGNDNPVALSTTAARTRDGGGWLNGREMLRSVGPRWDRMGLHAMDASDPAAPVLVLRFVAHDAPGMTTVANWDAQGLRATESHDTLLEDVFVPD